MFFWEFPKKSPKSNLIHTISMIITKLLMIKESIYLRNVKFLVKQIENDLPTWS